MYKIVTFLLGFTLVSNSSWAIDAMEMLKAADRFRLPGASALIETRIELYENNKIKKHREYAVYLKPGRRSLVVFKSADEIGQKMLMLGDNFWLVMPKSRRPIRITPIQKLLGEASSADIATMTWSEDYQAKLVGKIKFKGENVWQLHLKALHKGLSYQSIELFLAEQNYQPVKADLFLASGKLAKRAFFKIQNRNGQEQVTSMILQDTIQNGRETKIHYLSNEEKSIPEKYYNPAYLVRNASLKL